ncbi:MAG: PPOX class F420-dependent oxidoreductase [Acidimicrobiales bacterium]
MPALSEKAKALVARPVIATVATVAADGSPQVTPVWIETDGDDLVFNTARGRVKERNLERDPRVAVTVIDPDDSYNVLVAVGRVVSMETEGADAHIDKLAKKYLGVDEYPMRTEGEVRTIVRVRPDRIPMQG